MTIRFTTNCQISGPGLSFAATGMYGALVPEILVHQLYTIHDSFIFLTGLAPKLV
jgi:hypothetical protein